MPPTALVVITGNYILSRSKYRKHNGKDMWGTLQWRRLLSRLETFGI